MPKLKLNGLNLPLIHCRFTEIELDILTLYLTNMQDFLANATKEVERKYEDFNNLSDRIDNEAKDQLLDNYSEEYQNYTKFYPNWLRGSMLLQTYSLMEHALVKVCDYIQRDENIMFGVSEIKGNGDLDKIKRYLKRTCQVDFANLNSEWSYIQIIKDLRNKLVHENGKIEIIKDVASDSKLRNFIKKSEQITVVSGEDFFNADKPGQYEILIKSNDINTEFIGILKSFFKKLEVELYEEI